MSSSKSVFTLKGANEAKGRVEVSEQDAKYVGSGHQPALMPNTITVIPRQYIHGEDNSFGTRCRCVWAHIYTLAGKYLMTRTVYVSAFCRETFGTDEVTIKWVEATTKSTNKVYYKGEIEPSFSNVDIPIRVGKIAKEGSTDFELAITEMVAYKVVKGAVHYMPEYERLESGMLSMVREGDNIKLNKTYLPGLEFVEPIGEDALPEECKNYFLKED